MKKNAVLFIVIIAILLIPLSSAICAEVPSDFSMTGIWKAKYESKVITIALKKNHKGTLFVEGLKPITILKWDEKIETKGKVYIGLYFYSRDKERFVKRTLRMYNAGRGFRLKAIYQSEDTLKVYNALSVKDGKVEHNDGRMALKRQSSVL